MNSQKDGSERFIGKKADTRSKEGEDRVRSWLCRTVGVELWRGKGSTGGGGVPVGDRGEHAGSLLKCQERLQQGSGERRANAAASRRSVQPLGNGFKLRSRSLIYQTS